MLSLIKLYSNYLYLIVVAVLVFICTSYFYNIKIDKLEQQSIKDKNSLLAENEKINNNYIELQSKVKEKEKEDYEKFTALQSNNEKLLNDISSAKRQLRVKVSSCSSASAQTGASGMGNGEATTGVIDPGYAESIISITNKADKYKSQLEALQNYINTYNDNVK